MLSKSRVGLQLAGRAARSGLVTISTSPACSASGATAREKTLDTACLADRCSIAYIRQMQVACPSTIWSEAAIQYRN